MTALRVYVAGASAEVDMVATFIGRLREAGVVITYDWTADVLTSRARGVRDEDLTPGVRQACATADLQGVAQADVMWLLTPANASTGAWTELGFAIGTGTPLIISGEQARRSIFTEGRHCVATHEDALRHLLDRQRALAQG